MTIEELQKRIEELEETLKEHQHLGTDGSKEFEGDTKIGAKEIEIHGAGDYGDYKEEFSLIPLTVFDGKDREKRVSGMGIATFGDKGTVNEQMQGLFMTGKKEDLEEVVQTNRADFDDIGEAIMGLTFYPQFPATGVGVAGPSQFPPYAFLYAYRTPTINGTGTISGSTLYDSEADYKNDLTNSFLRLSSGEMRRISSNTSNTITVESEWTSSAGNYSYSVITPVFLGAGSVPFTRAYIGDDIRLGYGSSNGAQVQYIKWGSGSPEGVVTANIGSAYLRSDGSTGSTLYIKESGTSNTGWSAVGTISGFTGSFTNGDGATVSVSNGLITSVS